MSPEMNLNVQEEGRQLHFYLTQTADTEWLNEKWERLLKWLSSGNNCMLYHVCSMFNVFNWVKLACWDVYMCACVHVYMCGHKYVNICGNEEEMEMHLELKE